MQSDVEESAPKGKVPWQALFGWAFNPAAAVRGGRVVGGSP
jgi:hypothetical protein